MVFVYFSNFFLNFLLKVQISRSSPFWNSNNFEYKTFTSKSKVPFIFTFIVRLLEGLRPTIERLQDKRKIYGLTDLHQVLLHIWQFFNFDVFPILMMEGNVIQMKLD